MGCKEVIPGTVRPQQGQWLRFVAAGAGRSLLGLFGRWVMVTLPFINVWSILKWSDTYDTGSTVIFRQLHHCLWNNMKQFIHGMQVSFFQNPVLVGRDFFASPSKSKFRRSRYALCTVCE